MADLVVLIPHYNNIEGLKTSLRSIAECKENIDVLVVDDGSDFKPSPDELLAIYSNVKITYSVSNRGIESALNIGLREILHEGNHKYIARLDCGDKCTQNRFSVQKDFLIKHPEIHLLGCAGEFVDTSGKHLWTFRPPCEHKKIKRNMLINNMFIHPAVVFTVEAVMEVGHYPTNYPCAEDYAFFFKILKNFKTANLPDILIKIEVNGGSISIKNRKKQMRSRVRIIFNNFSFSPWWIYGLLRNLMLYCFSGNMIDFIKSKTRR